LSDAAHIAAAPGEHHSDRIQVSRRGAGHLPGALGSPLPPAARAASLSLVPVDLQRGVVRLAGTNANDALDLGDEDFAVADLSRFGGLHDGFDDLVDQVAAYRDLDAG